MKHSRKQFLMEASAAIGIVALLLYCMLPRFLSVQKYGPVNSTKSQSIRGTWTWEENTLNQSSLVEQALIIFGPEIESGQLSCKALVYESKGPYGFGVVFGFQNALEFYIWNIGGNYETQFEHWFSPTKPTSIPTIVNVPFYSLYPTGWLRIGNSEEFHLTTDVWHDVNLVLDPQSNNLVGFVDGQQVLHYALPTSLPGKMGLTTWGNKVKFKDVTITPIE